MGLLGLIPALAAAAVLQTAPPPEVPQAGQTPEAYDAMVRGDAAAAEALQGPLDGGWILKDASRRELFAIRIVDPGAPPWGLEAAWRDVKRKGPKSVEVVDLIAHDGAGLMLRFDDRPRRLVVITVSPGQDGVWTGRMWRGRRVRPVTLERD